LRWHASKKEFKPAESRYRSILSANPDDLDARAGLGDIMLATGDLKGAEREYSEVKRRVPNHPLGYMKLSACYMAGSNWKRAIAELEQLLKIHPDMWGPMNDLAYLLGDHGSGKVDLDRALALAQKADTVSPENPSVFDTLGWVHYRRGEFNEAAQWLSKAQAMDAENPVTNFHLGMAHYRAGNAEKAKAHLSAALAYKNSFPGREEAVKTMASFR